MLLDGRNTIIYGGGGAIGGAIARAFAREGARVFLAGRTRATLDEVAEDIRKNGGRAETAVLDALDESAVDAHADTVVRDGGSVDVSVNVIADSDVQGTPILTLARRFELGDAGLLQHRRYIGHIQVALRDA
jgi:3-oxoacyl-[acyl-carrier protein] reductase